jgi:hypothetical protein
LNFLKLNAGQTHNDLKGEKSFEAVSHDTISPQKDLYLQEVSLQSVIVSNHPDQTMPLHDL